MTLDVYADLFDDDLDQVAMRLDQVVSASDVGKMNLLETRGVLTCPEFSGRFLCVDHAAISVAV